ncbi:MAG: DUF4327 family protein [Xenococcus sp. (in: cyanobacteria)]
MMASTQWQPLRELSPIKKELDRLFEDMISKDRDRYSIDEIKNEARQLVECGAVDDQQPIWVLCEFIAPGKCLEMEEEIEKNHYLLREHIADLITK